MMRFTLNVLVVVGLFALVGCGGKMLVGKVVAGPKSTVLLVDADDPRLAGPTIEDAVVEFILDPNKGNRQLLGSTVVGDDGRFRFTVDAAGVGFLEYDLGVIGRAPKRSPATMTMPMPPAGKHLLVILAPGEDRLPATADPLRQSIEEADYWMP